jgi:hypothetical protein
LKACPSPSTITCRSIRRWIDLGGASFAERNAAIVNVKPCKFGPIFEQTGGLPAEALAAAAHLPDDGDLS